MNSSNDVLIKTQTLDWIKSFIIDYNICPFAKHVVHADSLHLEVAHEAEINAALNVFLSIVEQLDAQLNIETSLLIFPSGFNDFFDYLNFVESAETLLQKQGYEGVYQIATFHPDYCFADVSTNDVSNYTNRSPYPMVHLLRESSIDKAIAYYGDTENIPKNNITTMHSLGLKKLLALLNSI